MRKSIESENVGKLLHCRKINVIYDWHRLIAKKANEHSNLLVESAENTASCILFFNHLFDSMNDSCSKTPRGKELRGSFGNIQKDFRINEAVPMLQSIFFTKGDKNFKKI